MTFIPSTACVLGAAASIPNACNNAVWAQILAGTGGANASAILYDSSTSTAGKQIATLIASACTAGQMIGPFIPSSGLHVGNITSGSVIIWIRPTG